LNTIDNITNQIYQLNKWEEVPQEDNFFNKYATKLSIENDCNNAFEEEKKID